VNTWMQMSETDRGLVRRIADELARMNAIKAIELEISILERLASRSSGDVIEAPSAHRAYAQGLSRALEQWTKIRT
jgi:hypothetical protein